MIIEIGGIHDENPLKTS